MSDTTYVKMRGVRGSTTVLFFILTGCFANSTRAESQAFAIHIVPRLFIESRQNVEITVQSARENFVFQDQDWRVISNSRRGATVTLTAQQGFHHLSENIVRDARLELTLMESDDFAEWKVIQATSQTESQRGTSAVVQAESTKSGNATLSLRVHLLHDDGSVLPSGVYQTTILGMISAN